MAPWDVGITHLPWVLHALVWWRTLYLWAVSYYRPLGGRAGTTERASSPPRFG